MTLSTEAYKGTRDFYPKDMLLRNYIFDGWKTVMYLNGYEQYDSPILESMDLYRAKSGEELVNEQTYSFIDRGGREVSIRPEVTPSVCRMIAKKRQEIAYPARWFAISQMMRYERKQRGREREFWQLNCDMFGVSGIDSDVEVVALSDSILRYFGAKSSMYYTVINNRELVEIMMRDYLQLSTDEQIYKMVKLFDRKNKIKPEQFRDEALQIFGVNNAKAGLQKLAKIIKVKTLDDLPTELAQTKPALGLREMIDKLKKRGIDNASFDITLMRGLDYYTGMVFEVFDTHKENNRSLYGGGRYNGLVGLFGVEPIEAVGFAPGGTTMELFLKTHNLLPKLKSNTDIYLVVMKGAETGAQELAVKLRQEMVNVEVDITQRKLDKQLKTAIKKNIPYVVFVGLKELEEEMYNLKDLDNSEEYKCGFERLVAKVKDYRTTDDLPDELAL